MPRGRPGLNKPLVDYLTEMIPDVGENLQFVVKKAIRGLRAHQTPVLSKQDALSVHGIGEWVATKLETYIVNNSHLFIATTPIVNSFQLPQQPQNQLLQQQQQQQQANRRHSSTVRPAPQHPPSAAEVLAEDELCDSLNPMVPTRNRGGRGGGRGNRGGRGGRGGGGGRGTKGRDVGRSEEESVKVTDDIFGLDASLGTEQNQEDGDDIPYPSRTQAVGRGTHRGRRQGTGLGRGRGSASTSLGGSNDDIDEVCEQQNPRDVPDVAEALRSERENHTSISRFDGGRLGALPFVSSFQTKSKTRKENINANLPPRVGANFQPLERKLQAVYDSGGEFGNMFPIRPQRKAPMQTGTSLRQSIKKPPLQTHSSSQQPIHLSQDDLCIDESSQMQDSSSPQLTGQIPFQTHFSLQQSNLSQDNLSIEETPCTQNVLQIPNKRFTALQVDRSARVIRQFSAYSEEDCLAELAIIFEAGDFPRTDDKLYEALSTRLWERERKKQNPRMGQSPRSTAARVNALANSLRGQSSQSVFSDDDDDDSIRPVIPLVPRPTGHSSKSVFNDDDDDFDIRPAVPRVSRPRPSTEVITIDDSDDDSIICL